MVAWVGEIFCNGDKSINDIEFDIKDMLVKNNLDISEEAELLRFKQLEKKVKLLRDHMVD